MAVFARKSFVLGAVLSAVVFGCGQSQGQASSAQAAQVAEKPIVVPVEAKFYPGNRAGLQHATRSIAGVPGPFDA